MDKLKVYLSSIILFIALSASAEYFYMDKTYSDALVNSPIRANFVMINENNMPPELKPFTLTSNRIKSNNVETLFHSEVIVFSPDGTFSYIWMTGPSKTNKISGKWRVENSQLIFILSGDKQTTAYAPNTEMRYKINDGSNDSNTSNTLYAHGSYDKTKNPLAYGFMDLLIPLPLKFFYIFATHRSDNPNNVNITLSFKRCTYPEVTNTIPTSDNPIYDFERLAALVTANNNK